MFRHVLNFMRHGRLLLPDDFTDFDLLLEEARFFEIHGLVRQIEDLRRSQRPRPPDGGVCWTTNLNNNSEVELPPSCRAALLNGIKREDSAAVHD
ncbi:Potassium channel tetramerization-type BTB domain, partial [Trinorchestia longiramus]